MARLFAKVSEEKIKTAFFYPSDLVNTKTTIPLRVGEERWIYIYKIIIVSNLLIRSSNLPSVYWKVDRKCKKV